MGSYGLGVWFPYQKIVCYYLRTLNQSGMIGASLTVSGIPVILVIISKYYGLDVFAAAAAHDGGLNLNSGVGFLHGGFTVLDVKYDIVGDDNVAVVFCLLGVIVWVVVKQR